MSNIVKGNEPLKVEFTISQGENHMTTTIVINWQGWPSLTGADRKRALENDLQAMVEQSLRELTFE